MERTRGGGGSFRFVSMCVRVCYYIGCKLLKLWKLHIKIQVSISLEENWHTPAHVAVTGGAEQQVRLREG